MRKGARAQAAAKPEEGEASEDARGVDELRSALADAEAMNAALLEDVDATAVALDELRAQNASLIEGSSAHDAAWRASLQQATTQQAECRQAAAERVLKHAEKVRAIVKAMDGSECVRVADEQRAALEETVARVAPLAYSGYVSDYPKIGTTSPNRVVEEISTAGIETVVKTAAAVKMATSVWTTAAD